MLCGYHPRVSTLGGRGGDLHGLVPSFRPPVFLVRSEPIVVPLSVLLQLQGLYTFPGTHEAPLIHVSHPPISPAHRVTLFTKRLNGDNRGDPDESRKETGRDRDLRLKTPAVVAPRTRRRKVNPSHGSSRSSSSLPPVSHSHPTNKSCQGSRVGRVGIRTGTDGRDGTEGGPSGRKCHVGRGPGSS